MVIRRKSRVNRKRRKKRKEAADLKRMFVKKRMV
jgi:hypothetical protein